MTVEELRKEANTLGYSIVPIVRTEKLLPCLCGCTRRNHWITYNKYGTKLKTYRCVRCDREASGRTDREARRNWNAMVRGGQNAQTD